MLVRLALNLVVLRASSNVERDLEILALRHQVAVLRRQVKRPELLPAERLILAALGRRLPSGRLIFSPATLLRWHRELVRQRWSAYGRRVGRTYSSEAGYTPEVERPIASLHLDACVGLLVPSPTARPR